MGEMKCLGFSQQKLNVNNCACWYLHLLHLPPRLYSICCSHMKEFIFCKIKKTTTTTKLTALILKRAFVLFVWLSKSPYYWWNFISALCSLCRQLVNGAAWEEGHGLGPPAAPSWAGTSSPAHQGQGEGWRGAALGTGALYPPPSPALHLHLHATELSSLSYHCVVLLWSSSISLMNKNEKKLTF